MRLNDELMENMDDGRNTFYISECLLTDTDNDTGPAVQYTKTEFARAFTVTDLGKCTHFLELRSKSTPNGTYL